MKEVRNMKISARSFICLILSIIIVFVILSSETLADEILFRGIPWGSNVTEVLNAMPQYSNECDFGWETRIDAWNSFDAEYEKAKNGERPAIYYYGDLNVAGYKVSHISFQFLFSVDDEGIIHRDQNDLMLISAVYCLEVADSETAYTDLTEKLAELYGKGEKSRNEYGDQMTTWYGDNNTGVCLKYSEGSIAVWYGNTDDLLIPKLDKALAQEEHEKVIGNTDGL